MVYVWLRNARRARDLFQTVQGRGSLLLIYWLFTCLILNCYQPDLDVVSFRTLLKSGFNKSCNLSLSTPVSEMWSAVFSSSVLYWCISLFVFFRALFAYEGVTNNLKLTDSGGNTSHDSFFCFVCLPMLNKVQQQISKSVLKKPKTKNKLVYLQIFIKELH